MGRHHSSISTRLAIGLVLILAILGTVIAVAIYELGQLANTSQEMQTQQQVRRISFDAGLLIEELADRQRDFLAQPGTEWPDAPRLGELCDRMQEQLDALKKTDSRLNERGSMRQLQLAIIELRSACIDRARAYKLDVAKGTATPADLAKLHEDTRAKLDSARLATTSRRPGRNMRPSTMASSGWRAKACSEVPRTIRFELSPSRRV